LRARSVREARLDADSGCDRSAAGSSVPVPPPFWHVAVHRAAVARDEVFAELRAGAGERFDVDAVEVCLGLMESGFEFSQAEQ
jgi:hypothetical protein